MNKLSVLVGCLIIIVVLGLVAGYVNAAYGISNYSSGYTVNVSTNQTVTPGDPGQLDLFGAGILALFAFDLQGLVVFSAFTWLLVTVIVIDLIMIIRGA